MKLGSNAVEDACGVCHGDGTSCELHEGKRFFNATKSDGDPSSAYIFHPIFSHAFFSDKVLFLQICKGTVNIKVEEVEPSDAKIQVTGKGGEMLIEG